MARKKTQAYTEEFRREAVKRAEKEGNTTASVAKELGVSAQQIYNWRRQFNRLSDKQFNSVAGVESKTRQSRCETSVMEYALSKSIGYNFFGLILVSGKCAGTLLRC
ncbi:MAG: transposase-like protein [Thalassolituus sp.]|jgi:transposase-like protein